MDLAGGLTSFHIPADVVDVAHVEIPSDDYNFEDRVVPVFGMLKKLEKLTVPKETSTLRLPAMCCSKRRTKP